MVCFNTLAVVALSGFATVSQAAHESGLFAGARRWSSRDTHDLGKRHNSTTHTATTTATSAAATSTGSSSSSSSGSGSGSGSGNGVGFVSTAYYANWDVDGGDGFTVQDIPVQHLSHIAYAFANIASDGTVSSSDSGADYENKLSGDKSEPGKNVYGNFKQLFLLKQKNRKLKTTLSCGGGGAAGWKSINSGSFTTNFVKSAVGMVQNFGFDGIDLDFEFPDNSNIGDYATLITSLRKGLDSLSQEMNTTPFIISVAVAGGISLGKPYQKYIPQIDKAIDFWHVMAYDMCATGYQDTTCDNANLKGGDNSGAGTISWYIQQGATASKMTLGAPNYGYAYGGTTGHDQSYSKSASPKGDGNNGPGGYDVKHLLLSQMKDPQVTEDTENGAAWAYDKSSKILVSYDTPKIAQVKANYIVANNLAGSMYWEISSDNTGSDSLVAQYATTYSQGAGLHSTCNHIDYSKSEYANIKSGMGNQPASCDDSTPNTSSSSSSSSSNDGGSSGDPTSTGNGNSTSTGDNGSTSSGDNSTSTSDNSNSSGDNSNSSGDNSNSSGDGSNSTGDGSGSSGNGSGSSGDGSGSSGDGSGSSSGDGSSSSSASSTSSGDDTSSGDNGSSGSNTTSSSETCQAANSQRRRKRHHKKRLHTHSSGSSS